MKLFIILLVFCVPAFAQVAPIGTPCLGTEVNSINFPKATARTLHYAVNFIPIHHYYTPAPAILTPTTVNPITSNDFVTIEGRGMEAYTYNFDFISLLLDFNEKFDQPKTFKISSMKNGWLSFLPMKKLRIGTYTRQNEETHQESVVGRLEPSEGFDVWYFTTTKPFEIIEIMFDGDTGGPYPHKVNLYQIQMGDCDCSSNGGRFD